MLKVAYSKIYNHPLPENHRFPMKKYDLIPKKLIAEKTLSIENFFEPGSINNEDVLLTPEDYFDQVIEIDADLEVLWLNRGLANAKLEQHNYAVKDFDEAIRLADRIAIMYEGLIVQVGTPEELITNPATDYVAEFTKDIPRSKLLNAESIMNEKDKKPHENIVNYSDKIEKIASKVLKSESIFSVVDADKEVVGSVSKKELIKALFAEDKNE